ncbi:hypothetical protein PSRA_0811 [Pseudoscardovia radai]|uniref:NTP pyrophosphohydrolase MazG putative catalytic core domain-containing protein n=1 Tax=Pseudoscardovia radai TaxID=987066 RepID=A0A261EY01_9BIFI|nr:hypothetical protein [Pseudoscardovia radai]OZG51731.1 hypothetical protein PSRA_0811 [Pseudoscardovia radai]
MARLDTVAFPAMAVFDASHQKADKWQVLKCLEEAAELAEAGKAWVKDGSDVNRRAMLDELADVLQTLANLIDAYEITPDELRLSCGRVFEKNSARGMYLPGARSRMSREGDEHAGNDA